MDNLKKTAENILDDNKVRVAGSMQNRILLSMQAYAAQETAALRSENERLKEAVNKNIDDVLQQARKCANTILELREALKDMVSIAEQHYPEELERQYEPRIENAKKLTGQI